MWGTCTQNSILFRNTCPSFVPFSEKVSRKVHKLLFGFVFGHIFKMVALNPSFFVFFFVNHSTENVNALYIFEDGDLPCWRKHRTTKPNSNMLEWMFQSLLLYFTLWAMNSLIYSPRNLAQDTHTNVDQSICTLQILVNENVSQIWLCAWDTQNAKKKNNPESVFAFGKESGWSPEGMVQLEICRMHHLLTMSLLLFGIF